MGRQDNLLSSKGISPVRPHKGNSGEWMHVGVRMCVLKAKVEGRGKPMSQG